MRIIRNGGNQMIKKILTLLITTLLIVGCNSNTNNDNGKVKVITTLYPQYDLLKLITKDLADVEYLLPAGVEAHGYEPTPQDIVKLNASDLFVYTSDHLESYALNISKSLDNKDLKVLNIQETLFNEDDEHEHEEEHDHDDHGGHDHDHEDPHFWLDPLVMIDMAELLRDEMIELDPEHKKEYDKNTEVVIEDLKQLDQEFIEMFKNADEDTIVFSGHFAFDFFAQRYGMNYETPFQGFSANAEASPKRVAELIEYVKENNVKVIYFEELVDPKLAKMLSKETGAELLMLHAVHNVSKEELESEVHYTDIMRQNLENLKKGLYNE